MNNYNIKNAKRIWIMGDIHFGVRASSMEWFEITKSYFEDYFIPLLEREYKEGDILIQVGDIFENRQVVNLKVNSYVVNLFERLGAILPVIAIAGNHDIYYKRSNEVTSLDSLRFIPGITIYKDPLILEVGIRKALIMPWRHSPEQEAETLKEFPDADYVFCHSEMQGILLNAKVKQKEGTRVGKFKSYKRVYSGHIHFAQVHGNVYMVGNAYQMTRSDSDNAKGTYLLDLETEEHHFFENKVTPEFRKINIVRILEMNLGDFKKLIRGNFVDLYIPSDIMIKYNMSHLINLVQNEARSIDPNIYDEKTFIDIDTVTEEIQNGYKNFDVKNLCKKWIDQLSIDDEFKLKAKDKINSLYTLTTSSYNPDL
jgi:DNA repair exonuclease SbcCD nuclease subunit